MPLYEGPMRAWTCRNCNGTIHYRPGTVPSSWQCSAMGCSGVIERAPERDYGQQAAEEGSHDN